MMDDQGVLNRLMRSLVKGKSDDGWMGGEFG